MTTLTQPANRRSNAISASQYLSFSLGSETYAMPIATVAEIIGYTEVTQVPLMPAFIRGAINLRGAVLPVIDLSIRLGREPAEQTKRTCIVVVEVHQGETRQAFGVVVDAVHAVLDFDGGSIEPAPSFGPRIRTDFIAGMARVDGRFVIVLDLSRVLSIDDMAELAAAPHPVTEAAL